MAVYGLEVRVQGEGSQGRGGPATLWLVGRWGHEEGCRHPPGVPRSPLPPAGSLWPPPMAPQPPPSLGFALLSWACVFGTQQTIVPKTIRKIGKDSGCHSPESQVRIRRVCSEPEMRRNKREKEKGWGQAPQKGETGCSSLDLRDRFKALVMARVGCSNSDCLVIVAIKQSANDWQGPSNCPTAVTSNVYGF